MPILGVPASLGKPEQLSAKSVGGRYACASVNGQRDARESGVTPLLPRNCKRRLPKSGRPLPWREGLRAPSRRVRRPIALRTYVFLFRGEGELS